MQDLLTSVAELAFMAKIVNEGKNKSGAERMGSRTHVVETIGLGLARYLYQPVANFSKSILEKNCI